MGFTLAVILAIAGCSARSEPGRSPSAGSEPRQGSAVASNPVPFVAFGSDLAEAVPRETWSPEADRAQHERYHWPADFLLPIEICIVVPEVPSEIACPSPPIEAPK